MPAPSVWLTTLGCAKNQVDSEKIEVMLADAGYSMASSPESADVVMVNTCAFIEEARRESVDVILDAQASARPDAHMVVVGCMAQRFGVEVERSLPEVDAVVGLDRYIDLVPTLDRLTQWKPVSLRRRPRMDILHGTDRPDPKLPYAYVKVAEGCDKPCTFCAIPLIRGKQRSRRPSEIRREIEALADKGVREVVLVAQDLAAYGRDLQGPSSRDGAIVDLLRFVSGSVDRLRLLYLYPKEIRSSLVEEMISNPSVASYFDLSLQHASGQLLRAMKRSGDGSRHLSLVEEIRTADPKAALRSSFIIGFPGETDDDVEELGAFLESARLDWAGFFPYSAEEGTPAASLENQLPRSEIDERLRHVQGIQDEISFSSSLSMVGERIEVLVDQIEDEVAVGRSYREAPEIDGMIVLDGGQPGAWVTATVVAAVGTDLEAVVVS